MIFICTAMYPEAKPFIEQLRLKKDSDFHKFQVFKNDKVILIITGVGKIKSAIAISYLLSKYEPKDSDLLINIGVCGTRNENIPIGSTFYCNKIIDNDTKKTFYPDIIFNHPFKETSIETCSVVAKDNDMINDGKLVDMEASGIYQSALVFLQQNQIFFIKVVSDYFKLEDIRKEKIVRLIEKNTIRIINWIKKINAQFSYETNILSEKEERIIVSICKNFKLSCTMQIQFKQLLIYYKLQHGSFLEIVSKYMNIKSSSKKEGKRYFEEIKQRII